MTEEQLIEEVSVLLQTTDLPDFTPSFTGKLLVETMAMEWSNLSAPGRANLLLVLATFAKSLSGEARAERQTAEILRRLTKF